MVLTAFRAGLSLVWLKISCQHKGRGTGTVGVRVRQDIPVREHVRPINHQTHNVRSRIQVPESSAEQALGSFDKFSGTLLVGRIGGSLSIDLAVNGVAYPNSGFRLQ